MRFLKNKHNMIITVIFIIIILVLSISVFILSNDRYKDFKKGIYVRKQVGQIVIIDEGFIDFTFYSVKKENYDFLLWDITFETDDNIQLNGNDHEISVSSENELIDKIILTIQTTENIQLNGKYLSNLIFSKDNETIKLSIGHILIHTISSENYISGIMSVAYNAILINDNYTMEFTNISDYPILFQKVSINDQEFLSNHELLPGEVAQFEYSLTDLVNEYPNFDIVLNPLINFDFDETSYTNTNPTNSYFNYLKNESELMEFIKEANPI